MSGDSARRPLVHCLDSYESKSTTRVHWSQALTCKNLCGILRRMRISGAQVRAARGLLNWNGQKLAAEAGVGLATVRRYEGEIGVGSNLAVDAMRRAFEAAGVEFLDFDGVRRKQGPPPP